MTTRLHPVFEVVAFIAQQAPGWSITHEEMAAKLEVELGSKRFDFDVLRVRDKLFDEHRIVLSSGGRRFRILSDEEKVTLESARLEARAAAAIRKKAEVEASVDETKLDARAKRLLERSVQRTAVLMTAHSAARKIDGKIEDGSGSKVLLRLLREG